MHTAIISGIGIILLVSSVYAQKQPRTATITGSPAYLHLEHFVQPAQGETVDKAARYVGKAGLKRSSVQSRIVAESAFQAKEVHNIVIHHKENGNIQFIQGKLGKITGKIEHPINFEAAARRDVQKTPLVQETLTFLEHSGYTPGMQKPTQELRLMAMNKDNLDFQHLRFEQIYKGLRVHARDIYVHTNKSGEVYCINGHYEKTPVQVDEKPAISANKAKDEIRTTLQQSGEWDYLPPLSRQHFDSELTVPELLWYPFNGKVYLAYKISAPTGGNRPTNFFVNAKSGLIIERTGSAPMDGAFGWVGVHPEPLDRTKQGTDPSETLVQQSVREIPLYPEPAEHQPLLNVIPHSNKSKDQILAAGGFITVSGKDLLGITREVRAWKRSSDGRVFPVSDGINYKETPDENMPLRPNGGHVVLNANNNDVEDLSALSITFITEGQSFTPDIISALWNTDSCLRYFNSTLQRSSWDGKGTRMTTILNVGGNDRDQAWWNPGLSAQGYGPGKTSALSTVGDLWTLGHEVGHAVNSATARLEYNNAQQGSMEEHFANVWGWMIDKDSFWMARQAFGASVENGGIHIGDRDSIRTVANGGWPSRMSEFNNEAKSPHANGGIPNRALYLCLRTLGYDTTAQLWFRALTTYTNQNSGFADLRNGVVQAATDLYAGNTTVMNTIASAFDDAGITATLVARSNPLKGGLTEGSVLAAKSTIAFTTKHGTIGYFDKAANTISFFTGNAAVVRTSGGRSQLSGARNSSRIYFVNAAGRLAVIDVPTRKVSVFDSLYVRQPGDLLTAAVAPDEKSVALVSHYANDPNVYVATVSNVTFSAPSTALKPTIIPLKRDVSNAQDNKTKRSEGTEIQGIRYPEAVSWSPDHSKNPELVFDALSQYKVESDTVNFWSLFYVDLAEAKPSVYALYPPQPDVNLGFPVFGGKNPNTLAFVEYLTNHTNDIYVANFDKSSDVGFLNIPSFKLENKAISDLDQVGFSPDDTELCFISQALFPNNLFVYAFPQGNSQPKITANIFDSTVHRPFWSTIDLTTSVQQDDNGQNGIIHISPNPIVSAAVVKVSFEKPQSFTMKVLSMIGQELLQISAKTSDNGEAEIPLNFAGLPSGSYFCVVEPVALRTAPKIYSTLRILR